MGVYYALLLLIVVLAIITTYLGRANYLSVLNLSNVIYQSSLIAIMAVAMTVVLISGNFDLSVASVAAFAAVLLIGNADAIGFWPAAALALAAAMGIGLVERRHRPVCGHKRVHRDAWHHDRRTRPGADLYRRALAVGSDSPAVVETMKAVEGGRHDVFWLVVAAGVALLALGVDAAVHVPPDPAARLQPASVGMILGGLACCSLPGLPAAN